MTSINSIIERYANQAGTANPKFLHSKTANVFVGNRYCPTPDDTTIYSYGTHFPMARIMPDGGNQRGWWLVNGDSYSVSTSRHQSDLRSALKRTGLPMLIVPFSAISRSGRSGIRQESIKRVDVRPDRYTWEPRTRDAAPSDWERNEQGAANDTSRNWRELPDGRWSYETPVHHLGDALFTAEYGNRYNQATRSYENGGTAYFLSAFDENEPGFGLYFLAQLPPHAHPKTVGEAFEALKPDEVTDAEQIGSEVLRQGDVFAIARDHTTRDLPGPSRRSERVLGVNHIATEVRETEGHTYARGTLRHSPRESWRQPDHKRLTLGDRKTWYELVLNTVPAGRSWSRQGNVD